MSHQEDEDHQGVLPFPPQLVTKSNVFCRAQYDYEGIFAGRIVSELASRIRPDDPPDIFYDIPVANILNKNYAGEQLQQAIKSARNLVDLKASIPVHNKHDLDILAVITRFKYFHDAGIMAFKINKDFKDHLVWQKNSTLQYTQYDYHEFKRLGSTYSQKLYELFKSWKDRAKFTMSLDSLHWMLSTPNSYRKNFKDFRINVLEPAAKLIKGKTTIKFSWEAMKNGGRRVTEIKFTFGKRRVSESELEKIQNEEAKVRAYDKRRGEWLKSAHACVEEKKGVCLYRDRTKRVCAMCVEMGLQEEMAKRHPQFDHSLPSDIRWGSFWPSLDELPPDIIRSINENMNKPITTGKNAKEQD